MKKLTIIDLIRIDHYSMTAKYLQIANAITRGIESGVIGKGDYIPSINELSAELDIARDTVERGYRQLKKIGVIGAVPRKGFYIKSTAFHQELRIFLIFNKLSAHKKTIYDSFISAIGDHAVVDFYIYNNDFSLFKKLITTSRNDYTHYVIIPHFVDNGDEASGVINSIPKEKLVLLDKLVPGVTGEYAAAYENFENDIYQSLTAALDQLVKYAKLKIVFPENSYYPVEIIRGFRRFCQDNAFSYKIVRDIAQEPIRKGEVYINVMEDSLVVLLEQIVALGLQVGRDVGVISYNEVPLKKLLLNGLTTISTDFKKMGALAAELILSNAKTHLEVPFRLTLRASL